MGGIVTISSNFADEKMIKEMKDFAEWTSKQEWEWVPDPRCTGWCRALNGGEQCLTSKWVGPKKVEDK